jgi:hypothetical protein
MSRTLIVWTFLILILPNTYAFGQADPIRYRLFVKKLSKMTPDDTDYSWYRGHVREFEDEFRYLFRGMPPVSLAAINNGRIKKDWLTKIELELRRSRIGIGINDKPEYPSLFLQVSRTNLGGQRHATLELQERVTLSRPNRNTLRCTTYESSTPYRKTQAEAEKDLWAALDEFCLLYLKWGQKK